MSVASTRSEIQPTPQAAREIHEAVARIAASQAIGRSDQLRRLLLHLCSQALAGRQAQLHEQQIGVEVFGRAPDYDPGVDGIVRTHATRLRQRLELYFSLEGAEDPIEIEVPRGGYVPHFYQSPGASRHPTIERVSVATATESPATEVGVSPAGMTSAKQRWRHWPAFFLGVVFTLAAGWMFLHLRQDSRRTQESAFAEQTDVEGRFWSTLLPTKQQTRVIAGDSGLVMYETVAGREISLSEYLNGSYRGTALSLLNDPSLTKDQIAKNLGDRRYTSEVDLRISAALARLPQWNPARDHLIFARDLRPSDASESNLVLLGSRQADPWVSMLEPSMNFRLQRKPTGEFYYANAAPVAGEQQQYEAQLETPGSGTPVTYGDVAFFPNPSGRGMVLALGGLWASGTEAAGRFVLSGLAFSDWLRTVQRKDGSIPPFEILIASHSLDGTATRSEIVAQRVKQ